MTKITNPWIIPKDLNGKQTLRNGVTVLRTYGGINAVISVPDENGESEVTDCTISFHERELYPNGKEIKTELRTYTLIDLTETNDQDENGIFKQQALTVLTGFLDSMGYKYIIDPARETLSDSNVLPLESPNGYPLHKDTREKVYQPAP